MAAGIKKSGKKGKGKGKEKMEIPFQSEIILLLILAACIVMLLSNFGFGGFVGEKVSDLIFGLFGLVAYVFPVCLFVGAAFFVSNQENRAASVKVLAGVIFVVFLCLFLELVAGGNSYNMFRSFVYSVEARNGGGAVGGLLASLLCPAIGVAGAYVVDVAALIISLVILTERSFLQGVQKGGSKVYKTAREDVARRKVEKKARKEEESRRRMDRKVSGVALNTKPGPTKPLDSGDLEELDLKERKAWSWVDRLQGEEEIQPRADQPKGEASKADDPEEEIPTWMDKFKMEDESEQAEPEVFRDSHQAKGRRDKGEKVIELEPVAMEAIHNNAQKKRTWAGTPRQGDMVELGMTPEYGEAQEIQEGVYSKENGGYASRGENMQDSPEDMRPPGKGAKASRQGNMQDSPEDGHSPGNRAKASHQENLQDGLGRMDAAAGGIEIPSVGKGREYKYPSVSLLKKGKAAKGDSRQHLQETAMNLQHILKNFGVNVTITDVSCGPSVTRYEMQPEMGVKVSKIVNLADDIKLNLAAADIRIEAPIPGKAAVGIEVPNKETVMVRFRDLVESPGFQNHESNICFTVGKDIGGQPIVADIAKMPHLLIAGATGSGKSVCINTIIMSILYKANPEDVKLILIDPKVVELSVYNGIPHLMIPVVTDPKKAAGALHWAVSEMMSRYQKFSDFQVRDLKGYNKKAAAMKAGEGHQKMPQIIVVVDELADLMMVASKEVEDAICRLAQLARAAGIHLIIATQRPSVDVITGLIKANMPSRIAFSVSSSVDSRTILDMHGAEKLLGNGDMLFYPQGYPKPLRVQAPFVSDQEVEAVVDFLKDQSVADYNEEVEEQVNTVSIDSPGGAGISGQDSRDSYFAEAGRFVVEKEKGSIGMLQRMFRIGFNRAARIMDQLEEAGVVGPEEGTKPRRILMSLEEFEQYVTDNKI